MLAEYLQISEVVMRVRNTYLYISLWHGGKIGTGEDIQGRGGSGGEACVLGLSICQLERFFE